MYKNPAHKKQHSYRLLADLYAVLFFMWTRPERPKDARIFSFLVASEKCCRSTVQIVRSHLIYIIVQPIGIDIIGMSSPA